MSMEEYLGDIQKHHANMCKQIGKCVGKEISMKVLAELPAPTGDETPVERASWAAEVSRCLEKSLTPEQVILVRQECACVKTNKYSAYNQRYFPKLRQENPEDEDYLRAVAAFLSGRPRIGKRVEYADGKLITYMGEGKQCGCLVIKGGWEKPPTLTWCRCCQGTLHSIYQFVFPEKTCHMDIVQTHATGGDDCAFAAWYEDRR